MGPAGILRIGAWRTYQKIHRKKCSYCWCKKSCTTWDEKNPCKIWDKLPINWLARFLNNQQYHSEEFAGYIVIRLHDYFLFISTNSPRFTHRISSTHMSHGRFKKKHNAPFFRDFRKATIQQLEDAVSAESSSTAAKVKEMQEWQQEHNEAGSLAQPRDHKSL